MKVDPAWMEFATAREAEIVAEIQKHGGKRGGQKKAADALGITEGSICHSLKRLKKRAAKRLHSMHAPGDVTPPGFSLNRVSTLRKVLDPVTGEMVPQWQIARADAQTFNVEDMVEACRDLEGLARPLPPKPSDAPREDLMSVVPMGDPHFGMYAWGQETGQQDFDLRIAERQWQQMIDNAVAVLPYTQRAVFIQLGDLTHGNDHKNVTPQSGHVLDVDTRHGLVMRAAYRAMVYAAERMREKCVELWIESIGGNHSPETVMALNIALDAYFRDADDVQVSMSSRDIRLIPPFGDVMVTASHGDKQKPERLGSLIPAHYREEWGRARYAYHHGGHVHHTHKRDIDGVVFESHRSPAPMDAYAAAKFWSEQSVDAIVYHRTRGEIRRHTIGIETT